jgi:hypothetical protein
VKDLARALFSEIEFIRPILKMVEKQLPRVQLEFSESKEDFKDFLKIIDNCKAAPAFPC